MATIHEGPLHSTARESRTFSSAWTIILFAAVGLALALLVTLERDVWAPIYDPLVLQEALP